MPVIIDGTNGVQAAAVTTTSWNPTNLVIPGNSTIGDASSDTLTVNATPTLNINPTLSAGTANGVTFLNSSKVLTSGSALLFDGTLLSNIGNSSGVLQVLKLANNATGGNTKVQIGFFTASTQYGQISAGYGASSPEMNFQLPSGTSGAFVWGTSGSSEDMRLISTGLGIGTSSPIVKLDVFGPQLDTNNTGNIFSTDNSALGANKGGGVLFGGYYTGTTRTAWAAVSGLKNNATDGDFGGYLAFKTRVNGGSLSEVMRIDSSGNLGLGVTPSTGTAYASMYIGQGNSAASYNSTIRLSGYSTTAQLRYTFNQAGAGYGWGIGSSGNDAFIIGTVLDGATGSLNAERMRIDSSGNVGINTTNYGAKLHVAIAATPSSTVVTKTSEYTDKVVISSTGSNNGDKIPLVFQIGGVGTKHISSVIEGGREASGWNTYLAFRTNNITDGTNTDFVQEKMRIDSSGNVGIGISNPGNKLHVYAAANPYIIVERASPTASEVGIQLKGGTGGTTWYMLQSTTSNTLDYWTSAGYAARLSSSGALAVGGAFPSSSGAGITFPASQYASSDANTLDDYEEGTFTPQIIVEGASAALSANNIYYAYYNKIGRTVNVSFHAVWNSVTANGASANGAILIQNLPFAYVKNGTTTSDSFMAFAEVYFSSSNFYQGVATIRTFNGATSSSNGGYLYVSTNGSKVDTGSYARVGGGPINNGSSMALAVNMTYTTST